MKLSIIDQAGGYATAVAEMNQGETLLAEPGAMVAMSATLEITGQTAAGGFFKAIKRTLAGESFFRQSITASRGAGRVMLAPAMMGDIRIIEMQDSVPYMLQKGAFLASAGSVEIDSKMQGLAKGMFSGEGFFILTASGTGPLLISSFGSIQSVMLGPGEELLVDNGHLVAWPASTAYLLEKAASGWISSLTSGEGLVCRFRGPGEILIQTRNANAFGNWISSFIPKQRGS